MDLENLGWNGHFDEPFKIYRDAGFIPARITSRQANLFTALSEIGELKGKMTGFEPNYSGGMVKGSVKCSGKLSYRIDSKSFLPYEGEETYSASYTFVANRGKRSSTTSFSYELTDTARKPRSKKGRR